MASCETPQDQQNASAGAFSGQSNGDQITILSHSVLNLAKTWQCDGSIKAYDQPKRFSRREVAVNDIHELSGLLTELETNPKAFPIRGLFAGDEAATKADPDGYPKDGLVRRTKDVFRDQPLHFILIEIDNYRPEADSISNPEAAVEEFIRHKLPVEFHLASYHWQLSSSAGHPTKQGLLKAHVWFWLETPATSAQLKQWAKANDLGLDASVFNEVQIHYTSKPLFEAGVIDPVPLRSGFVEGITDVVGITIPQADAAKIIDRGNNLGINDPVVPFLENHDCFLGYGSDDKIFIECPFKDSHTGSSGISETSYLPAGTNGELEGHFVCQHEHCRERTNEAYLSALGFHDNDFEISDFDPTTPEHEPQTEKKEELFPIFSASEYLKRPRPRWIIEDLLPEGEIAAIYGASTGGKSFLAIDMALSIARGVPWLGREVIQGRVVYLAAEGAGGCRNRLEAYEIDRTVRLEDIPFQIIPAAPNFLDSDDALKVVKTVIRNGGKASVIFVDTLAQVTSGGNENAAADMSKALRACKQIHAATGALVVLVAHVGKDAARGLRGWSGMFAALDAAFCVVRDGNRRRFNIAKQKDGPDEGEWTFELRDVFLTQKYKSAVVDWISPDADIFELDAGSKYECALQIFDEIAIEGQAVAKRFRSALSEKFPFNTDKPDSRSALARRLCREMIDEKVLYERRNFLVRANKETNKKTNKTEQFSEQ